MAKGLFYAICMPKNSSKPISIAFKRFTFSPKHYQRYQEITSWGESQIHPVYPYALLTDLHLQLVSDVGFPYSAFGILHRREEITLLKSLGPGEWAFSCQLLDLNDQEGELTFKIRSELSINGELCWVSQTYAIKRQTKRAKHLKKQDNVISDITPWLKESRELPCSLGLRYGLLSGNIDPIHIHPLSAKLMGHPTSIMHGMWGVAYSCSLFQREGHNVSLGNSISIKFISPIYLPREISYFSSENAQYFGLYNAERSRPHLLIELS